MKRFGQVYRQNIAVFIYAVGICLVPIVVLVTWIDWSSIFQSASSCKEECFVKWVGALSGWVGGAAAVATLLLIRRTLKEAQKANDLMQHQTRVITGELDPVLNYNGTHEGRKNLEIFRFWNYNRRAITVDHVSVLYGRPGVRLKSFEYIKPYDKSLTPNSVGVAGSTVFKTIEIKGTAVGHSPEPCTFYLEFEDLFLKGKKYLKHNPVIVEVWVQWRFRDENKGIERTISVIADICPYS